LTRQEGAQTGLPAPVNRPFQLNEALLQQAELEIRHTTKQGAKESQKAIRPNKHVELTTLAHKPSIAAR
jgi:Tfp pilus assembly protein PilX